MASLTLKDIPSSLLERLRRRARGERRSLSQEALRLLEQSLQAAAMESTEARQDARKQVDSWVKLARRWRHDGSHEDLIQAIYDSRTGGRTIEL